MVDVNYIVWFNKDVANTTVREKADPTSQWMGKLFNTGQSIQVWAEYKGWLRIDKQSSFQISATGEYWVNGIYFTKTPNVPTDPVDPPVTEEWTLEDKVELLLNLHPEAREIMEHYKER